MIQSIILFACLTLASFQTEAAAPQSVPFKGSSENQAISAVPDGRDHVFVTTVGSGHATHLGKFTFISPHRSGLTDFSIDGVQIFTAANGDELHATLVGNLRPTVDAAGHVYLVGDVDGLIVGGTGRFSNAAGSFVFSLVFDTATASSRSEISGSVRYAGK